MQAPTPDDEFEYLPAWQGMHAVPLLYVPMLHTTHVDDPAVAANWPVAQVVQFATPDDEFENCPAAHGRQPVPFTLLYEPTLHAVQVDRPVVEAYWPAMHAKHALTPMVPAYFPAAH